MPPSPSVLLFDPTLVQRSEPVSSSEAASLKGKPAKTPIIAGSICGSIILIAWSIGIFIWLRKRYYRRKQQRAAEEGLCPPPPEKIIPPETGSERIVIPPDPAVLLGYAKPGDIGHPRAAEAVPLKSPSPHVRGESGGSLPPKPVPTPSRPVPLAKSSSGSGSKGHQKNRSHSSSKLRPSSPKKRSDTEDELTAPLNPHHVVD